MDEGVIAETNLKFLTSATILNTLLPIVYSSIAYYQRYKAVYTSMVLRLPYNVEESRALYVIRTPLFSLTRHVPTLHRYSGIPLQRPPLERSQWPLQAFIEGYIW